jgi:hypothetical protein
LKEFVLGVEQPLDEFKRLMDSLGLDTMVGEDTFDDLVTGITPPKLFFPAIKFEYKFILVEIYLGWY